MKRVCLALLGLVLMGSCAEKRAEEGVVETTFGKVSGNINEGIYEFLGIPYGECERFQAPHDPTPWDTVRICTKPGPRSNQDIAGNAFIDQSKQPELAINCQNLNVWTANINNEARKPVMVWLHGGGYTTGSSYQFPYFCGESMARHSDVVIVSVNHRLNIEGFLDLSSYGPEYDGSGAAGMLDIVKALEWVHHNIEKFGGDPGNVTLFGESGGGGKVGTLMCMPAARGLFHKAIIESGAIQNLMTTENSSVLGRMVVKQLFGSEDALDKAALDTLSYARLMQAGQEAVQALLEGRSAGFSMFGFSPSADGKNLAQQPYNPGFSEFSKDIPVLIGSNANELSVMNQRLGLPIDTNYVANINRQYGPNAERFIAAFKKAYPESTERDWALTDHVFRARSVESAKARAAEGGAPAYLNLFTYEAPERRGQNASVHGLEEAFVFDNVELDPTCGQTEEDYAFEKLMTTIWTNFAKTGDPNTEGLPEWKPVGTDQVGTMILDSKGCGMKYDFDNELQQVILENLNK